MIISSLLLLFIEYCMSLDELPLYGLSFKILVIHTKMPIKQSLM